MKEVKQKPLVRDTLVDRLIAIVSPAAAVSRRAARLRLAMTGGYSGASRRRQGLRNYSPYAGSADGDVIPDLDELRSRSRDLARNQPIAHGAIETKVINVIGGGLSATANIDGDFLGLSPEEVEAWEDAADREWLAATEEVDITGHGDFADLQALAFRAVLESGDAFLVRQYRRNPGERFGTKWRLIEADRCSTPTGKQDKPGKMVAGVEMDSDGRPVAYHFTKAHPGDMSERGAREWTRVPAFDGDGQPLVKHLFFRRRPGQTRGVPDLATVIEPFKQMERYSEAELQAAVISAMFTAFVETEGGGGLAPTTAGQATGEEDEIGLRSGAVINLRPGEKVAFADPTRPNSGYDSFITSISKHIGVALGLPADVLLKQFNSSYSASRAALDTAWQYFRTARKWSVKQICVPVRASIIAEAVAEGRLPAPGFFDDALIRAAYCRANWTGDGRIHIDPVKEANADRIYHELGVISLTEIARERRGANWEEVNDLILWERERGAAQSTGSVPIAPISPPAEDDDIPPEETDDDTDEETDEETDDDEKSA